jgi:DNA-binding transcriptional LysR family regulator
MQLEALQIFCAVVRFRSFSRAAVARGITQSAASHAVQNLEKELGNVQLIDRTTRPPQPTPVGQRFYEGCKSIVEQYRELEASVRRVRTQQPATVQVAAIYSIGLGDMGHYLERFAAMQPSVKVHVEYLHSNRVVEKALAGGIDFGLVSFPRKSRDLVVLPWREEEMVLACQPTHPLARFSTIRPAQLAGQKYVGFDKDLGIRRQVDRFLRQQGVAVEVALEFDSIEHIKKGIEIAGGVALLPEPTLRQEVESGLLVARSLNGCRFVRPLAVIHHRQHRLGPAAQRFLELVLDNGGNDAARNGEACNGRAEAQARSNGTTQAQKKKK